MDKDQLNDLITQICGLDISHDGDQAEQTANDLRNKVIDQVRHSYDQTVSDGSRVFDDLGRLESDVKSLRDRVHNLEDKNEVKDEASHLREEIDKVSDAIHRMFDAINADKSTLDRVKDGTMAGSNNPTLRARMEYGKEMHRKLQNDRNCDEREVSLSSGRPDCIKFDQDDCVVIEFKPSTYTSSQAEQQAEGYIRDVRDRFKKDDRAKRCKQDADGPIFKAKAEFYTACRP